MNRAEGEIRELTPDENAAYDAFEKLLDVVNSQIRYRKDNSIEGPLVVDGTPGSQSRAVWVANYNILPSLLTMQDPGNRYIWAPVGYTGAAQAMPASLLGREIIFTEKSPALGSKGDLMLVDFKGYAVCLTPQFAVQASDAPRWYENERSFRIETRVDGTMLLDEPIVPRKGSDTLSTTVVLNA